MGSGRKLIVFMFSVTDLKSPLESAFERGMVIDSWDVLEILQRLLPRSTHGSLFMVVHLPSSSHTHLLGIGDLGGLFVCVEH